MNHKISLTQFVIVLILVALLGACVPPAAIPTAAPLEPTATSIPPTDVPTVVPPTATSTATATATAVPPTHTPTVTPTKPPTATPTKPPTATKKPKLVPTSTQAKVPQKPTVKISVFCALFGKSPSYVEVDQPVVLTWVWRAATEVYRQDYINAASFSVQIDGQSVDVSSVAPTLSSQSNYFFANWSLPPRTFAPGKHQSALSVTLSRQITDGFDSNNDGTLDPYSPGLTTLPPCEIIVQ